MRYLIIILLFASFNATAQDLNETVDYINNILRNNHSWIGGTGGIIGGQGPTYLYDKIFIDTHGKMDLRTYDVDSITDKIITTGPACYAYLKSLVVQKGLDWIKDNVSIYRLVLVCSTSSGECIICASGTANQTVFFINNYDARERLQKAFFHLLELAKNDKNFYEKDPFSN